MHKSCCHVVLHIRAVSIEVCSFITETQTKLKRILMGKFGNSFKSQYSP